MGNEATVVDVSATINQNRMGRVQIIVVAVSALVAVLDGLDLQMIGLAAPAIAKDLHIPAGALGVVFSAALGGLGIGAFAIGPLADRIGRKRILIGSTLWFGLFTLLAATSGSVTELLVYRLLAGIGLGGAMPSFIGLSSEYVPVRRRSLALGIVYAGVPLGGIVSSLIVPGLTAVHGWQASFVVGGVVPIVVAILVSFALPESLTYLVACNAPTHVIRKQLAKVVPDVITTDQTRFVTSERRTNAASVRELFVNNRAVVTVLLWVSFFVVFMILATDTSWLPTLLAGVGLPVASSATALLAVNIGSVIGSSSGGWLLTRFRPGALLPVVLVLGTLSLAATGLFAPGKTAVVLAQFVVGLTLGCSSTGVITLAANTYPTAVRATGVGWAMGMGRVGSFLGPLGIGLLVSLTWSVGAVLSALGATALIAAICTIAVGRRTVAQHAGGAAELPAAVPAEDVR